MLRTRLSLASLIFVSAPLWLMAQIGNCDNAGFELGTTDGYSTFVGEIDDNGFVTIDLPGPDPERHRIMNIAEGFDPIASQYCMTNAELPVVPQGAGQYSMRLGNENNGAEAERVLLEFTVTEERNFFLLSYAVILADPGHPDHQQPRFELRIFDENDEVLPCGLYQVRAAESIEGFENCASWRVRPWTTAGFELQSYLGQTIKIEILTTDCSQGGHAGYAYFDASCRPLEIELRGYCPGTTSANLIVTEGFEEYLWSTGDTTNIITIDNPQEGEVYSVTVTSATGCTLVMTDTLPTIQELPVPSLTEVPDTSLCPGNGIWFTPTGQNLQGIFSPTLGFTADSFFLFPQTTTTYSFIASDEYACTIDSISYTVYIDTISSVITVEEVLIDSTSCADSNDGRITILANAAAYLWEDGSNSPTLDSLGTGEYSLRLFDEYGCFLDVIYEIESPDPLGIISGPIVNASCFGADDGSLTAFPIGGTMPYYSSSSGSIIDSIQLDGLTAGTYQLSFIDNNNCFNSSSLIIEEPQPIVLFLQQDSVRCFGEASGTAIVNADGGTLPYSLEWNDEEMQSGTQAINLYKGIYTITLTDDNGCVKIDSILVEEPNSLTVVVQADSTSCHDSADGAASITAIGGNGGYSYLWNDASQQVSAMATDLPVDTFFVLVTDYKGCETEATVMIPGPRPLDFIYQVDSVRCFGESNGGIQISPSGGNGGYLLDWPSLDENTATVSGLFAGNYVMVLTDAKGCELSENIAVLEPSMLSLMVVEQTFPDCINDKPGITIVEASGGNGGIQYNWNNGVVGDTISAFNATNFIVIATDYKGCTAFDSVSVLGLEATILPEGPFVNEFLAICDGEELQLTALANNVIQEVSWAPTFINGCLNCINIISTPTDSLQYTLFLTDVNGCMDTATQFIPLNKYWSSIQIAGDFIDSNNELCFGDELRLNIQAVPPLDSVSWMPSDLVDCIDCSMVRSRPSETTTYEARVWHENGCVSKTETPEVIVNRIACPQFIPNVFSPNGDGLNDFFNIPGSKAIEKIESLKVFDRWGNLLFSSKDLEMGNSQGWDGKYNSSNCAQGVYVYLIKVRYFDGQEELLYGDVTLLR